ncbi:hypothetical protein SLEP1_g32667 [Rubroshorea leprosula]|uniref:Uncharacterized protein n=1 Tax=Rubroshorea leprosula TaxID=152421 RepID=A0AAV5KE26_9ROSI|nr:hypothetical protein SLEP1_g32667 [Rubroshorea leprosula]
MVEIYVTCVHFMRMRIVRTCGFAWLLLYKVVSATERGALDTVLCWLAVYSSACEIARSLSYFY